MKKSSQETYLGDIVHKSGQLKHTVNARVAKGFGAINTILAIINEIPLGHWRIMAGLQLRQAIFLNAILFNSEAWHGISDADIEHLEKVDEALLRGILRAHSKIALEALYLETGSLPIRYILKNRRLCYLYTIITKEDEEIVKEIYNAQKICPTAGDYFELIEADKVDLDIKIGDDEITGMKKQKSKDIIKRCCS